MTKAELIERIARSRDLPPDTSKKLIGQILGIAFDELASYFARARVTRSQSPRFTFPRFGTFTKKRRSARRGVNPRTLEPIQIEACNTIDFKASRELRESMNPSLRAGEAAEAAASASASDASAGWTGDVEPSERAATPKAANAKKKTRARAKVKAKARDAASPRVLAGPSKRRLTPRDEPEPELEALEPKAGPKKAQPKKAEPELPPSPMQRASSRRRTRSRGAS